MKVIEDPFQGRNDVLFGPPQRRQSQFRERLLDVAHVVVAQGQVVNQVARALAVRWMDALNDLDRLGVVTSHLSLKSFQLLDELLSR